MFDLLCGADVLLLPVDMWAASAMFPEEIPERNLKISAWNAMNARESINLIVPSRSRYKDFSRYLTWAELLRRFVQWLLIRAMFEQSISVRVRKSCPLRLFGERGSRFFPDETVQLCSLRNGAEHEASWFSLFTGLRSTSLPNDSHMALDPIRLFLLSLDAHMRHRLTAAAVSSTEREEITLKIKFSVLPKEDKISSKYLKHVVCEPLPIHSPQCVCSRARDVGEEQEEAQTTI